MDLQIGGKKALITGAAGTIGRATASRLLAEGVGVVLSDTPDKDLEDVRDALENERTLSDAGDGPSIVCRPADLSSAEGADVLVDGLATDIDILVHAAGITGAKGDPLDPGEDDWTRAWQIDFMSAVRLSKALVPRMADAGWGRVVFITSENASQSYPDEVVYNSAKAALLAFAKGLSMPYAKRGVLVNCVAPAFIETNMTDQMMEKRAEEMGVDVEEAVRTFLEAERPYLVLERRGRAEEVADVIAFLCSRLSSFVVGSNYRVDGGAVVGLDV
ncbi:MAG: SDR family oxidoreductase [Planctomycetota bacterium]